MTDVDSCETNPEQTRALSDDVLRDMIVRCDVNDIEFIHVSADYVFDGTGHESYSESADTNPMQVYGESKLASKQAVIEETTSALVA